MEEGGEKWRGEHTGLQESPILDTQRLHVELECGEEGGEFGSSLRKLFKILIFNN